MYFLKFTKDFEKIYLKLTKSNFRLQKQFAKVLDLISEDPFYNSLKTHKVDTKKYQNVYSSSVSGDVRIIWKFDDRGDLVILILETGTHSGASQVYISKSS
jgi:mRNA-degrading endonuclease YafQ of YafQ-DinJ toxin-antitoxin module